MNMPLRHDNSPHSVDIDGRLFRSIRQASKAHGVSHTTIMRAIQNGTMELPAVQRSGGFVNGVYYPSKRAAAVALGVQPDKFNRDIQKGTQRWEPRDRYAEVVKGYKDGLSASQVAKQLNVPINIVYADASKARVCGDLPNRGTKFKRTAHDAGYKLMAYRALKANVSVGSLVDVINLLPPITIKWLVDVTVPGSTVAATITSLINDAYAEENP